MALVIIGDLGTAFDIGDSVNGALINTLTATSTVFEVETGTNATIEFTGSGFTYGMSPPPTGGTVSSVTFDQFGNEASGFRDIEIYGLSAPLPNFQSFVGTAAEQTNRFWSIALEGDDLILLPFGVTSVALHFAGDGANLPVTSTPFISIGGNDQFFSTNSALTNPQSELNGDFSVLFSGSSVAGGDDFFNVGARVVTGDFSNVFFGAAGVGGDDVITPLALFESTIGLNTLLVGDSLVNNGVLSGGDDLIDLRETDLSQYFGTLFLYGDSSGLGLNSALTGGDDTIHGSLFGETIFGEAPDFFNMLVIVRGGNDLLFGNGGSDTINGGSGADTISGGDAADSLIGGTGSDTADYSEKTGGVSVNLFGGTATTGGALNAGGFYVGGAVEDTLSAIENIIGSAFGDRLVASNTASGRLRGGNGSDNISGLNGADVLSGEAGADTLDGGAASDTLNGGAGSDTLNGNTGLDTADYSDRDGGVNVNLINGTGITGGAMSGANYVGGALEDTIIGVENAIGSAFGDRLVGVSAGSVIDGGGGNDRISGFSGMDVFRGGSGDDTIEAGGNNDTLNGGLGFDTLDGSTGNDTADFSDRNGGVMIDLIFGLSVTGGALISGVYQGGAGEDTLLNLENIIGSNFADHLIAKTGNAILDGRGGSDRIDGNTGNDSLTGAAGNDTISGAGGGDTIKGGIGNDSLTGGTGDDQFFIAFGGGNEQDTISDFAAGTGVDEITLSGFGPFFDTFAELITNAAFQSGADTVLEFSGQQSIVLQNVTLANLTAADFVFI